MVAAWDKILEIYIIIMLMEILLPKQLSIPFIEIHVEAVVRLVLMM